MIRKNCRADVGTDSEGSGHEDNEEEEEETEVRTLSRSFSVTELDDNYSGDDTKGRRRSNTRGMAKPRDTSSPPECRSPRERNGDNIQAKRQGNHLDIKKSDNGCVAATPSALISQQRSNVKAVNAFVISHDEDDSNDNDSDGGEGDDSDNESVKPSTTGFSLGTSHSDSDSSDDEKKVCGAAATAATAPADGDFGVRLERSTTALGQYSSPISLEEEGSNDEQVNKIAPPPPMRAMSWRCSPTIEDPNEMLKVKGECPSVFVYVCLL